MKNRVFSMFCLILLYCCLLTGIVFASVNIVNAYDLSTKQDQSKPENNDAFLDNIKLFDESLINQDGEHVKFRSDVIRDRLVVINFVYSSCTQVCPIQLSVFSALQDALGKRLGTDVFLVSISIDPKTDIPARLKSSADNYKTREGWIWLTGNGQNVNKVLLGLDAYSSDITRHPAMVIVGDGHHNRWLRLYGFPSPEKIVSEIDELDRLRAEEIPMMTMTSN